MTNQIQSMRNSPNGVLSHQGHDGFIDPHTEGDFFPNPIAQEEVFEAIQQFASGAETITLDELRSEIAQPSQTR